MAIFQLPTTSSPKTISSTGPSVSSTATSMPVTMAMSTKFIPSNEARSISIHSSPSASPFSSQENNLFKSMHSPFLPSNSVHSSRALPPLRPGARVRASSSNETLNYGSTSIFQTKPKPTRSYSEGAELLAAAAAASSSNTQSSGFSACTASSCVKPALRRGLCIEHGPGRRCQADHCTSSVVSKGLCIAHGGGRRCKMAGCERGARTRGLCFAHGGGKRCNVTMCTSSAQRGGYCFSHAPAESPTNNTSINSLPMTNALDKMSMKTETQSYSPRSSPCSVQEPISTPMCTDSAYVCLAVGCDRRVHLKGSCCSDHHLQRPECTVDGCRKPATRANRCHQHGGDRRCQFYGCTSSARSRGLCYAHGGGRRCKVSQCGNGAVSNDLCKKHGGGRRCSVEGCSSSAESKGLCYSHGGGRRCALNECNARAKRGGFCNAHRSRNGGATPLSIKTDISVVKKTTPTNATATAKRLADCGTISPSLQKKRLTVQHQTFEVVPTQVKNEEGREMSNSVTNSTADDPEASQVVLALVGMARGQKTRGTRCQSEDNIFAFNNVTAPLRSVSPPLPSYHTESSSNPFEVHMFPPRHDLSGPSHRVMSKYEIEELSIPSGRRSLMVRPGRSFSASAATSSSSSISLAHILNS